MMILQYCKTQIMAILILAYVELVYIKEGNHLIKLTKVFNCNKFFDTGLTAANLALLFDGITACTVNLLDQVPRWVNLLLHFGMFASYDVFVALLFWYWVSVTVGIPKKKWQLDLSLLLNAVNLAAMAWFLKDLNFIHGVTSNYSMGMSVYLCFLSVVVHCVATLLLIALKYREIPKKKRMDLFTTLFFIVIIMTIQIVFPESLVSCFAVVLILISIYLNMENPAIHSLEHYQNEMIMGFATLVENKDDSTGGHIRRSSAYAKLIAKKLKKNKKYRPILTRDYLNHLEQSAPMHDIGKIGISDAILQKPGKLTAEEYEKMKEHAPAGGRIIQETFGHLFDQEYETMAFQVARFHHEKWNGKGYPDGLKGEEIPLCARIMAVADVFDAVSSKRCYRDAMPLDACYDIIRKGRGEDFDPDVVDAFLSDTEQVERIYDQMIDGAKQRKDGHEIRA